jgi:Domain of unknown function (DUF222)
MPALHDALAAGAVSAGHVDQVARADAQLDDAARRALNEQEAALSPQRRRCRWRCSCGSARILSIDDGVSRLERLEQQRRVRRWVDRQTGMCHTHLELDPESDAKVSAALDRGLHDQRPASTSHISVPRRRERPPPRAPAA